jgi:membrane protease subunit HflK
VTRSGWLAMALLLAYLASGFYVVGGDETAVVRRFGRAQPEVRRSGLHYEPPWPLSRVDRVNLAAVRTLTVGAEPSLESELMPASTPRTPAFLTGDKNILLVRASVQYRVPEDRLPAYLFDQADVTGRLRLLVETALTDTASRCGVDYLHTFGLAELNQRLTRRLREDVRTANMGVEIDLITLERVEPPARVQAEFLDVANARAEAAKAVHDARTYSEQRLAAATSEANQLRQRASAERSAHIARAQGQAARYEQLVAQIAADATQSGRNYAESRKLAIRRLTLDTLAQALSRVARRVVIDAGQPIDLNIQGGALPAGYTP